MGKLPGNKDLQSTVRIFLVDAQYLVRNGLKAMFQQEKRFQICGEASSAHEALASIPQVKPHLVILDLSLQDACGLEFLKQLLLNHPTLLILVVSMYSEFAYAESALLAGAHGYITKLEADEKIIPAIYRILEGEIYLDERMSALLASKFVKNQQTPHPAPLDPLYNFTEREREIFKLIGSGWTTKEIADQLQLSVNTVHVHRSHIREKLGLKNGHDLLCYAVQWRMEKGGRG